MSTNVFFAWLVEMEYISKSRMKHIRSLPEERKPREYLDLTNKDIKKKYGKFSPVEGILRAGMSNRTRPLGCVFCDARQSNHICFFWESIVSRQHA